MEWWLVLLKFQPPINNYDENVDVRGMYWNFYYSSRQVLTFSNGQTLPILQKVCCFV